MASIFRQDLEFLLAGRKIAAVSRIARNCAASRRPPLAEQLGAEARRP